MLVGAIGCGVDSIGIILKFLAPHKNIWILYTLLLTIGWSTYSLAQLLVLYSRLHLVNQRTRVQRFVFGISISTVFISTIPTWIVVFQAWNPNPKISSVWSPREAIVERYNQIVYTVVELIISGIYIGSLLGVLHSPTKSSVRQRRVMHDLIYVNIIVVALDIASVIMVYLNQVGLSHPIQTFSYAFKIRLEFVVLNQLMSVAARGLKRETFEEKRYHHPSQPDTFSAELRQWGIDNASTGQKTETSNPECTMGVKKVAGRDDPSKNAMQVSMPSPVYAREHHRSVSAVTEHASGKSLSPPALEDDISEEGSPAPPESPVVSPKDPHTKHRGLRAALQSVRRRSRRDPEGSELRPISGQGQYSTRARGRRHQSCDDDDEEEEVGLHMWENRGRVILEIPWFGTAEASAHGV